MFDKAAKCVLAPKTFGSPQKTVERCHLWSGKYPVTMKAEGDMTPAYLL